MRVRVEAGAAGARAESASAGPHAASGTSRRASAPRSPGTGGVRQCRKVAYAVSRKYFSTLSYRAGACSVSAHAGAHTHTHARSHLAHTSSHKTHAFGLRTHLLLRHSAPPPRAPREPSSRCSVAPPHIDAAATLQPEVRRQHRRCPLEPPRRPPMSNSHLLSIRSLRLRRSREDGEEVVDLERPVLGQVRAVNRVLHLRLPIQRAQRLRVQV